MSLIRTISEDGTTMRTIAREHVHLAVWFLLLAHTLLSRLAAYPVAEWATLIASTNLMVLVAFLAIFHLLTDDPETAPATRSDYILLGIVALGVSVGGLFGSTYDVPFLMAGLAGYYISRHARIGSSGSVGLVYLALFVNGFLAPLIFMLYKDIFLIGEVDLAVRLNALVGITVAGDGTLITGESGMRLRMVGACSVFTNLSYAFLGYASVKAFFRLPLKSSDIVVLLVLSLLLMVMNSARLGLMTPSRSAYEFWHGGEGAVIVSAVQMALICAISVLSVARSGALWRA